MIVISLVSIVYSLLHVKCLFLLLFNLLQPLNIIAEVASNLLSRSKWFHIKR